MDASRIKAARQRLWRAWLLGGLVWSVFFLGLSFTIVWLLGADGAQTVQLALTLALVICGGFYGFIHLGAVAVALLRWVTGGQSD
jgi:hypothetical protein